MPCFADLIPQLGNHEKQQAVAKALQDYDQQMDSGMLKIEEGTKLAAQGKMEIQEAHSKVVHEIRGIFGGVDASLLTPARDDPARCRAAASNATDQEMLAQQGTPNVLVDQPETCLGKGIATKHASGTAQPDDASVAHASTSPVEGGDAVEEEGHGPSITTPSPAPAVFSNTLNQQVMQGQETCIVVENDGSTMRNHHGDRFGSGGDMAPPVFDPSPSSCPNVVHNLLKTPMAMTSTSNKLLSAFDKTPVVQREILLPPVFDATPLPEHDIRVSTSKAPTVSPIFDLTPIHPHTEPDKSSLLDFTSSQATCDSTGIPDHLFDREEWNDVANIIREINETPLCEDQSNAKKRCATNKMEVPLRRSTRLNKDDKGEAQHGSNSKLEMMDLGIDLIMRAPKSTRFLSPFAAQMYRRPSPDVEKVMKVRDIIVSGVGSSREVSLQSVRLLLVV
ncbi:unnamed protein product [Urochloa humidicola]